MKGSSVAATQQMAWAGCRACFKKPFSFKQVLAKAEAAGD
jgi:hypothetical protein